MTSNDSPNRPGVSSSRNRYWRSLAELQESEDFKQYLHREFPVAASEFPEGISRRRWLQLMGASFALAGVAGCRYPEELIAPFVIRPEGRIPGEPYLRATNFELAGRVYNLMISNVDGRPIKIEPNPLHPSGSGTDVFSQASILSLYDPDRTRGDDGFLIRREAGERPKQLDWDSFDSFGSALLRTAEANRGGGRFAVLVPPTRSPSMLRLLGDLQKRLPEATVASYDSVQGDVMSAATEKVFGEAAEQVLDLAEADVIVSLQADILGADPGFLRNTRQFAARREPEDGDRKMNRLYVVEGGYTPTGAVADSRLALRPSEMPAFLSELGRRVDALQSGESEDPVSDDVPEVAFDELNASQRLDRYLDVLAHDVANAGDRAVIVVGSHLGAEAVEAGILMNKKLGSLGKLQRFHALGDRGLKDPASLSDLVTKIDAGEIDQLLILGGNPVFTAPGDVDFAGALGRVETTIYLGEYDDETAELCGWSLPLAHPLESWGDCVDLEGNYGVCQPHILPLLGGRTVAEVLAVMLEQPETDALSIVRRTADQVSGSAMSDREWRKLLHDGFAEGLTVGNMLEQPSGELSPLTDTAPTAIDKDEQGNLAPELKDSVQVVFVPADGIFDGRFANNAWLQELPQSLTKVTWDNCAIMSPATAKMLGIRHGLRVALRQGETTVELPVFEMPGCAPAVVTVAIGYGRTRAGQVGGMVDDDRNVVGVDVSPIRTSDSFFIAYEMEARPRFDEYELATTQNHWAIDEIGRDETEQRSYGLIREGTLPLYDRIENFAETRAPHVPQVGETGSPFEEPLTRIQREQPSLPQWGMAIDLSKCTGCNACVVACQSENNVPVVGREQVLMSREMHWLRVDRYFQGDADNADVVQQPVACMHCETAPCEQVCPVAATVHTEEGINAMVYNRCIGTRYCANNCPFKVRRFNYFNYNDDIGVGYGINAYQGNIENANRKLQQLVLNPEVTVRGRGVMEKCTYCVQRVERAKIDARREGGRPIRDGEVVTACQSACPAQAIEFGNISDENSAVRKKRDDPRSYGMLEQLNVRPRTEYLARILNPHRMLMTRFQIHELLNLEPPHHAHAPDEHELHGDEHGDEAHGDSSHAAHGNVGDSQQPAESSH